MLRRFKSQLEQKMMGFTFVLVAAINFWANFSWLKTGDIHTPHGHIVMRGGEFGFWLTTMVFTVVGVIGIYYLVTPYRANKT
jgi:uncharacterized membrane protein